MDSQNKHAKNNLNRVIKKLSLSAFVVISFILYAPQRPSNSSAKVSLDGSQPNGGPSPQALTPTAANSPANDNAAAQQPQAATSTSAAPNLTPQQPTATTSAPNPSAQNGQYKDGTYTGPEVDAMYGLVQAQAVIKNGKIANVQFLEYPNDRRTSVRINSYAVPVLQQEAVQAQSANVDLITGATLTSEAFQMSLQTALNQAKGF